MRNLVGLSVILVCLVGCADDAPETVYILTGGTGGDDASSSSTGSQGGGNSSSTSGQGESGGGTCEPSVTCASVQAECGTILDNGCGESVECPDNCQAPLVCGGGGDQFKCGCTPQSCEDLGFDCGTAENGCGGSIECGTCMGEYEECGGAPPNQDNTPGAGEANICGGGCTRVKHPAMPDEWHYCQTQNVPNGNFYRCTKEGDSPPIPGCEIADGSQVTDLWCCPL